MYVRSLLLSLTFLAAISTSGCAIANRLSLQEDRHTTVGQELIDLKKAKDAGLLTDSEYAAARTKIMNWGDLEGSLGEACKDEVKAKK